MLDKLHLAGQFEPREVVVHEAYRKRDIGCITYVASATARQQFRLLPKDQQVIDNTLGHRRSTNPPGFVVMTWFTRPFIGAVLAALAYLALSSGFFVLAGNTEQHYALFSLVGALAGLCERWIFFRRV